MIDFDDTTDPIALFHDWQKSVEIKDPNAAVRMILATATVDGTPSARVVLYKGMDETPAVYFVTNTNSRKAQEFSANPKVALVFFWEHPHTRQVRIEGFASPTSCEWSTEYFQKRPRTRQIGAWASPQSQELKSREELQNRCKAVEAQFAGQAVLPLPPNWGGVKVAIQKIEFWEDQVDRLHDRFLFTRKDQSWVCTRLAP